VEAGDDVAYLGPVGSEALRNEMAGARALLLLSSIEGFGLPALEAWFVGTPVCYAAAGSLPEVLDGVPGRCESPTDGAFGEALDAVLSLEESHRVRIARHLRERYGMDAFCARVENLFARWMAAPRRRG
jgi:glycosyltransferase involved in cell wall biosynthesis